LVLAVAEGCVGRSMSRKPSIEKLAKNFAISSSAFLTLVCHRYIQTFTQAMQAYKIQSISLFPLPLHSLALFLSPISLSPFDRSLLSLLSLLSFPSLSSHGIIRTLSPLKECTGLRELRAVP